MGSNVYIFVERKREGPPNPLLTDVLTFYVTTIQQQSQLCSWSCRVDLSASESLLTPLWNGKVGMNLSTSNIVEQEIFS